MKMKMCTQVGLSLALMVGCGTSSDTEPTIDLNDVDSAFANAGGKADRNSVQRVGNSDLFRIYDEIASELVEYSLAAGGDTFRRGTTNYVQSSFAYCAYRGTQAACVTRLDVTVQPDENELLRFGGPLSSGTISSRKALDLALTMRDVQGITDDFEDGFNPVIGNFVKCELRATPRPSFARCAFLLNPERSDVETRTVVKKTFDGLEPLGEDFVYEGWLIVDGEAISGGRFDITENTQSVEFELDGDLSDAAMYVLTIEPAFNDDPGPAPTHVLAGPLNNGSAVLEIAHPAAIGSDFTNSEGAFFLETPTSDEEDDFENGIWFLDPALGEASLRLPELPNGWAYEGWVVGSEGPISTGRFLTVDGADSDAGGPAAGPNAAPPFPGQDFVNPPMNLVGSTVVISVEPEPDNSPAPFTLKPLVAEAQDVARGTLQSMSFNPQIITGSVTIETVERQLDRDMVLVANRAGKSISVIDADNARFRKSIALPDGGEAMYIAHTKGAKFLFVGDRANNRLVMMDAATFEVEAFIPTGDGPFHMFQNDDLLLVANDIDGTATVLNTTDLASVTGFTIAEDLIAAGGKPHDAVLDAERGIGWISILGVDNPGDWVVAIELETGVEIDRVQVGSDPHLSFSDSLDVLFILSQGDGVIRAFDPTRFEEFASTQVPNAHGAWSSGQFFFTTNIADGGENGVVAINLATGESKSGNTPFATPHNVVSTHDQSLVYVSHSGPKADKVTVFSNEERERDLVLVSEITTAQNPFGIFLIEH